MSQSYGTLPKSGSASSPNNATSKFTRRRTLSASTPLSPREKHNHHSSQDGALKAAVFGFSDGLCTNVNVILGMYAAVSGTTAITGGLAASTRHILCLTGLCGMLGGASSMACGEWLSASAEAAANKSELAKERWHHESIPDEEDADMKDMLLESGLSTPTVEAISSDLQNMSTDQRVAFHAKYELGIEEEELSVMTTIKNAAFMWCSFAVGAIIPLLPWLAAPTDTNLNILFVCTLVATAFAMLATSIFQVHGGTHHLLSTHFLLTFGRQLLVVALAVGVTVGINLAVLGTITGS